MRPVTPRIAPLAPAEWSDAQREVLEPAYREGRVYNVTGTLARHWKAYEKFRVWSSHVMGETQTLAPRERELLILRTGWLCRSEYEWGQHVRIAR
jgi:alkylhydroperoxidase family enzyme